MHKADIITLYNYNSWANARVLRATEYVSTEQFVAPVRVSFGSLRGTLVHALSTEWMWRVRCQEGVSPISMLAEEDFPTVDSLVVRWHEEEAAMRAFLNQLDDEHLNQSVAYATTKGVPYTNILWQLLFHVVNHSTQFRSEAGVVLTEYGFSPGDLDMIVFLREQTS